MRRLFLTFLLLIATGVAFAFEMPPLAVSVATKPQVPVAYAFMQERKPLEPIFGTSVDTQYGFLGAGFEFYAGKDIDDEMSVFPLVSAFISLPINSSRVMFGRGWNFKDKTSYFKFGYSKAFKNNIFAEIDLTCPSKFSFSGKNWTELNSLKYGLTNTGVTLKAGYVFQETDNKEVKEEENKVDWGLGLSQSVLFTGFDFTSFNEGLRFDIGASMPIVYGLASYWDDSQYSLQPYDAAFFTSVRFDMGLAFELLEEDSKFQFTVGPKLISLWFNGQYIEVPAFFQAYSLTCSCTAEFWINNRNGLVFEAELPAMTLYCQENEKGRLKTIFTDKNTTTVLKYMTKVAYVHKIKNR